MAWAGGIEEENGDAEKIDEVLEFGLMESGGERCGELLGRLGTIHHELVTADLGDALDPWNNIQMSDSGLSGSREIF